MTLKLEGNNEFITDYIYKSPSAVLDTYLFKSDTLFKLIAKYPDIFKKYREYYEDLVKIYLEQTALGIIAITADNFSKQISVETLNIIRKTYDKAIFIDSQLMENNLLVFCILMTLKKIKIFNYFEMVYIDYSMSGTFIHNYDITFQNILTGHSFNIFRLEIYNRFIKMKINYRCSPHFSYLGAYITDQDSWKAQFYNDITFGDKFYNNMLLASFAYMFEKEDFYKILDESIKQGGLFSLDKIKYLFNEMI